MISRELSSTEIAGLSVLGSARCEITSLPPHRPISSRRIRNSWFSEVCLPLVAELASRVPRAHRMMQHPVSHFAIATFITNRSPRIYVKLNESPQLPLGV